jgi:exopolysaccharide biosynthesis polyprenyl glycosylphosphotransferase
MPVASWLPPTGIETLSESSLPRRTGSDAFEFEAGFTGGGVIDLDAIERFVSAPGAASERLGAENRSRGSRVRREYHKVIAAMACSDVLAVLFAFLLASLSHEHVIDTTRLDIWVLLFISPVLVVGVFAAFRLYAVPRMTAADEFRRLILGVTMIVTSAVTFSFWTHSTVSRMWIGLSWVLALFFVLASRWGWRKLVGRWRERGRLALRTLIVGANAEAGRVVTEMRQRGLGFVPLGYVCADAWGRPTTDIPMIGHLDDLTALIAEYDADCVFVASSAIRPEHMAQVSKAARHTGIEVRITANVQEVLSTRVAAHPLGGLMAFALKPVRLSGVQALAKRSFDLFITVLGAIVLSPIFALIAIAVKLTSRGPILFKQERVGYHGRPFKILKFRTMVADAEEQLQGLLHMNEATGPLFKIKHDPRVTKVGRLLRTLSLDELPQLFNVIRGDMSLVGPRPPLPREVAQYEDWMLARLEVRPGITGLWQTSGRSELPFEDYVRLDLFYIENWSLAYDLFILAKTVPTLVTARGAH